MPLSLPLSLRPSLPVLLVPVVAAAMIVPAAHAHGLGDGAMAWDFLSCAALVTLLAGLVALAMGNRAASAHPREALLIMAAGFGLLPLIMAAPLALALPEAGLFNAWWEMVSSMTGTGATLFAAQDLAAPLHLWRGLAGWLGGLFVLVLATAIMLPLRLGGFELIVPPAPQTGQGQSLAHLVSAPFRTRANDPGFRLARALRVVAPAYAALTLALWLILLMLGDGGFVALMRALGTVSTSGIAPWPGAAPAPAAGSGRLGEMAVLVFLVPALSRRLWPGAGRLIRARARPDPEIRMAALLVGLVTLVLLLRHVAGPAAPRSDAPGLVAVIWGALFNALSFLTTTGWNSADWQGVGDWTGPGAPGLVLAGLAMMGGGVATTAGGVKLMRVHVLALHSLRELGRIIHPASVGGTGRMAGTVQGAGPVQGGGLYAGFIFFMLFALSIAAVVLALSLLQIELESATLLAISALSNTGQLLPVLAEDAPLHMGWPDLPAPARMVLALAMIAGRVETLAILALLTPEFWRR